MDPAANIGPGERRKRIVIGVIMLGGGALIASGLVLAGAARAWRFVLLLPFWAGALGLFQARDKT